MTEAPTTPAPDPGPDPAAGPEPERVLSRGGSGRMLTGVCAGLGRFTGMDPVLFRVGFAVLVLASGTGILLYVAAFLLMRQPGGQPGHLEQWTRRLFDAETVLALMAAVFALGLIINVGSGGVNKGTIVIGTLLAIVLLAAHARGVDLRSLVKSMPERATGRRGMRPSGVPTPAMPVTATFPQPGPQPTPQPTPQPAPQQPYGAGLSGNPASPQQPHGGGSRQEPGATAAFHGSGIRAPEHPAPEPLGANPPSPAPPGYRRLSDLAREARAGTYGYTAGEPYAPHGPYAPRQPRQPMPAESYRPVPPPPARVKVERPKSFIGGLTICLALLIGGIMVAVQQSGTGSVGLPVIGG
ncbi:PspC domain-containing protein, partial [Sphaerimonospora thailandensis]|uniref:PspC domain-containing protein n=1 Tax=Sphaerimonospora thailandensis TaxID=795644 RepID=UPI00194F37DC